VIVALAVEIPRKLDLHATVLVGVDLLAGRTDHDGRLDDLLERVLVPARAERDVGRRAREGVGVDGLAFARDLGRAAIVLDTRDDVGAVEVLELVIHELETRSRLEPPACAPTFGDERAAPRLLEPGPGAAAVDVGALVLAVVLVDMAQLRLDEESLGCGGGARRRR
jgi:hypothetical protein